jgi:hypothetical protein
MRCPICHNPLSLEAIVEDESGQQLFQLIFKQPKELQSPLVAYLGLFRKGRDLPYSKSLRLVEETLQLSSGEVLISSLHQVVDAMRQKQLNAGADWQPLKNHNYLKQVINSVQANYTPVSIINPNEQQRQITTGKPSKTLTGIAELMGLRK